MIKHYITKGSEVDSIEGTFKCESYDGTYVWGRFTDIDGNEDSDRQTLPEVAEMFRTMDGKNHKVFWEEGSDEE